VVQGNCSSGGAGNRRLLSNHDIVVEIGIGLDQYKFKSVFCEFVFATLYEIRQSAGIALNKHPNSPVAGRLGLPNIGNANPKGRVYAQSNAQYCD